MVLLMTVVTIIAAWLALSIPVSLFVGAVIDLGDPEPGDDR